MIAPADADRRGRATNRYHNYYNERVLTICRENASEPDTRDRRARSHSDRACPAVRRTFVPRFRTAFGLVCPGRRRHLACRAYRLVDRVEELGLSDTGPPLHLRRH